MKLRRERRGVYSAELPRSLLLVSLLLVSLLLVSLLLHSNVVFIVQKCLAVGRPLFISAQIHLTILVLLSIRIVGVVGQVGVVAPESPVSLLEGIRGY
jgi:hypothetical protein